ncbi:MAG: hypothetical protein JWN97_2612 [Nocardioides sp.]|nr:hypothetical protein [Nocardioides sp.]
MHARTQALHPVMFDDSAPGVSTHLLGVADPRARPSSTPLLLRHTPLADRGGFCDLQAGERWPFGRPVEPLRHLHAKEVGTGDCLDARDVGEEGVRLPAREWGATRWSSRRICSVLKRYRRRRDKAIPVAWRHLRRCMRCLASGSEARAKARQSARRRTRESLRRVHSSISHRSNTADQMMRVLREFSTGVALPQGWSHGGRATAVSPPEGPAGPSIAVTAWWTSPRTRGQSVRQGRKRRWLQGTWMHVNRLTTSDADGGVDPIN